MKVVAQVQGTTGMVRLEGRFTFEGNQAFKAATDPLMETPGLVQIHLDLGAVSYMDSSSLGMLLVLRERAQAKGQTILLVKPSPCVYAILNVVQFGKLFQILA